MHQSTRARTIQKSLGTPVAARYLLGKGWHINMALFVLTGKWGNN